MNYEIDGNEKNNFPNFHKMLLKKSCNQIAPYPTVRIVDKRRPYPLFAIKTNQTEKKFQKKIKCKNFNQLIFKNLQKFENSIFVFKQISRKKLIS